jgi:hypothetical protein
MLNRCMEMSFRIFLEMDEAPTITFKPVEPGISWPDAAKTASALNDEDSPWFFYLATCTGGGRTFTFKLTKHRDRRDTIEVDGLSSDGDMATGLTQFTPLLAAELKKRGITNIKWEPALMQFGHHRKLGGGDPQRMAAIRDRLFNRMLSGTGLNRVSNQKPTQQDPNQSKPA